MKFRIDSAEGGAILFAFAFSCLLLVFGLLCHPMIEANSVENDGYAYMAMQFHAGQVPVDSYHPLLYPLVTAGVGTVAGDFFLAAKLVSTVSAGVLIYLTFLAGTFGFTARTGWLAAVFTALNINVVVEGVHASTDALFAALSLAFLYFTVKWCDDLTARRTVLLALIFALAYFTRFTAVGLAPVLVLAIVFLPNRSVGQKIGRFGLFALSSLAFLLPHFFLSWWVWRDPFYNDSWKNLAFKLYTPGDWSLLHNPPYSGLLGVILHSPAVFFQSAWDEFLGFVTGRIADDLGYGFFGAALALLAAVGIGYAVYRREKRNLLLLSAFLIYLLMICTTWTTMQPRHMMPVIPVLAVFAAAAFNLPWAGFPLWRRSFRLAAWSVAVLALAVSAGFMLYREGTAFADRHSVAEYRIAEKLWKTWGPRAAVVGTTPQLLDKLDFNYTVLPDVYGNGIGDSQKFYRQLQQYLGERKARYLIVGRLTLGRRPRSLLRGYPLPPYLKPLLFHRDVVLYQVKPSG